MIIILSRSETLYKLIEIRKLLNDKKECSEVKTEIDKLLLNIIGVSKNNQYKINEILNKAISCEIKARTAVVAIHEIITDNNFIKDNKQNNNKEDNDSSEMEELYERGYR